MTVRSDLFTRDDRLFFSLFLILQLMVIAGIAISIPKSEKFLS